MSFELYNRPTSWQYFINDTLFSFLYYFVQTYLDDIFIYNKTLKDPHLHVGQILKRLRKVRLKADINKYNFHIQEVKFFSCIIFTKSIWIEP